MIWQTDLASFLLDHLTFMEEQLSVAKTNSADQFAAIDAAKSAFVLIQATARPDRSESGFPRHAGGASLTH